MTNGPIEERTAFRTEEERRGRLGTIEGRLPPEGQAPPRGRPVPPDPARKEIELLYDPTRNIWSYFNPTTGIEHALSDLDPALNDRLRGRAPVATKDQVQINALQIQSILAQFNYFDPKVEEMVFEPGAFRRQEAIGTGVTTAEERRLGLGPGERDEPSLDDVDVDEDEDEDDPLLNTTMSLTPTREQLALLTEQVENNPELYWWQENLGSFPIADHVYMDVDTNRWRLYAQGQGEKSGKISASQAFFNTYRYWPVPLSERSKLDPGTFATEEEALANAPPDWEEDWTLIQHPGIGWKFERRVAEPFVSIDNRIDQALISGNLDEAFRLVEAREMMEAHAESYGSGATKDPPISVNELITLASRFEGTQKEFNSYLFTVTGGARGQFAAFGVAPTPGLAPAPAPGARTSTGLTDDDRQDMADAKTEGYEGNDLAGAQEFLSKLRAGESAYDTTLNAEERRVYNEALLAAEKRDEFGEDAEDIARQAVVQQRQQIEAKAEAARVQAVTGQGPFLPRRDGLPTVTPVDEDEIEYAPIPSLPDAVGIAIGQPAYDAALKAAEERVRNEARQAAEALGEVTVGFEEKELIAAGDSAVAAQQQTIKEEAEAARVQAVEGWRERDKARTEAFRVKAQARAKDQPATQRPISQLQLNYADKVYVDRYNQALVEVRKRLEQEAVKAGSPPGPFNPAERSASIETQARAMAEQARTDEISRQQLPGASTSGISKSPLRPGDIGYREPRSEKAFQPAKKQDRVKTALELQAEEIFKQGQRELTEERFAFAPRRSTSRTLGQRRRVGV